MLHYDSFSDTQVSTELWCLMAHKQESLNIVIQPDRIESRLSTVTTDTDFYIGSVGEANSLCIWRHCHGKGHGNLPCMSPYFVREFLWSYLTNATTWEPQPIYIKVHRAVHVAWDQWRKHTRSVWYSLHSADVQYHFRTLQWPLA